MEAPQELPAVGSSEHIKALNSWFARYKEASIELARLGVGMHSKLILCPVLEFGLRSANGRDIDIRPSVKQTDQTNTIQATESPDICTSEVVLTTGMLGINLLSANDECHEPRIRGRTFRDSTVTDVPASECRVKIQARSSGA